MDSKQVRVAIVGASCIGKTCVIKRFVENSFHGPYNPTPGVDFFTRRLNLKTVGMVTYIIVDVASSAITSKMLPIYIHGIDIFLLSYDMTNAGSLAELRKWISIINAFSSNRNTDPSIALVGCKGDLEHLRAVRLDAHTRFAQEHNIPMSFLSSAKSGESVVTCFTKCAIYHLNPDAKQRVREHAILQANVSATSKRSPTDDHHGPQGMKPIMAGSSSANTHAGSGILDPNSTVCVTQ